jgi:hypothetical protein
LLKVSINNIFNNIFLQQLYFCLFLTANDGFEALNVVGKNGYLIIDIIAYKREIPPFDLEIINGNF